MAHFEQDNKRTRCRQRQRNAEQFAAERATLEDQWGKGDNVSTEDLRQSLKRYRSFFDRLLSF